MSRKNTDPARLSTMIVAARFQWRYQKARDIMLSGKLGEPQLDPLTVPLKGVEAYERKITQHEGGNK